MAEQDERDWHVMTIRTVLRSAGADEPDRFPVWADPGDGVVRVACVDPDRFSADELDRYQEVLARAGYEVTDDPDDEWTLLVRWRTGGIPADGAVPAAPPYATAVLAEPGARLGARVIDIVVMLLGLWVTLFVWSQATGPDGGESASPLFVAGMVVGVLWWVYGVEAVQLARWSRTVGMRAVGVRVARADRPDEPLTVARALARAACYPIGTMVVGYVTCGVVSLLDQLWLLWDKPLRQCLHDKVASTVVVTTR